MTTETEAPAGQLHNALFHGHQCQSGCGRSLYPADQRRVCRVCAKAMCRQCARLHREDNPCGRCEQLERNIQLHDGRGQAALDARLTWHRALDQHKKERHENKTR